MPALALNQIELQDKRVTNKEGLQLIYEARDLNIAESTRQDGPSRFAFQKLNSNQTKARATESLNRINKDVPEYVEKAYWSQAGMELRRQLNTMRFDINNLVDEKGATGRKRRSSTRPSRRSTSRSAPRIRMAPRLPLPPCRILATPSSRLSCKSPPWVISI